jgi:signal transduction histidine kinase
MASVGATGDARARLRRWRAAVPLPETRGVARRPGVFVLLFWSALAAALLTRMFDPLGEGPRFGPGAVGAAALALVTAWLALPWDRRSGAGHKLLALGAFVSAAFALCHTTSLLWTLPLYAIAVANGVFLFGFRPGVAVGAVTVTLAFAGGYLYGPPAAAPPETAPPAGALTVAAFLAGVMVPVAAFVLGICKALVDSEQNREEARRLLAELDRANAELRRRASTVRALAIAEERARMAREVHDSVGHHLTAIQSSCHGCPPRRATRAGPVGRTGSGGRHAGASRRGGGPAPRPPRDRGAAGAGARRPGGRRGRGRPGGAAPHP